MYFFYVVITSHWRGSDPLFWQIWIPFTQTWFVLNLNQQFWRLFLNFILVIVLRVLIIFSWIRAWSIIQMNWNPSSKDVCAKLVSRYLKSESVPRPLISYVPTRLPGVRGWMQAICVIGSLKIKAAVIMLTWAAAILSNKQIWAKLEFFCTLIINNNNNNNSPSPQVTTKYLLHVQSPMQNPHFTSLDATEDERTTNLED